MPRTVREKRLDSPAARAKLKPSGKPYWRAIDTGLLLGYRKGLHGGRCVCRRYLGAGQYEVATVAIADDHSPADGTGILDFFQAQRKAGEVAAIAKMPPAKAFTVAAAMDVYFERLEHEGSRSLADAKRRTRLWAISGVRKLPPPRVCGACRPRRHAAGIQYPSSWQSRLLLSRLPFLE